MAHFTTQRAIGTAAGLALVLSLLTAGPALASGGAPVASDLNVATGKETPRVVPLAATDPDSDPLTYTIVDGPSNGVLTGSGATRTYTPGAEFSGLDSFSYQASDGTSDSDIATVTVFVGSKYTVVVTDSSVTSDDLGAKLGGTVRFKNTGTVSHTVTDSTGALATGAIPAGGSASLVVFAAGIYNYTVDGVTVGRVKSVVGVTPQVGPVGSTFAVRWGAQDFPSGYVADIEIGRPGTGNTYVPWQTGVTTLTGEFTPDVGSGSYRFRARVRNTLTGLATDWSTKSDFSVFQVGPPVIDAVTIMPQNPATFDVLAAQVQSHDPDGPVPTFTWQWTRNGVDLPGATGANLDLAVPGNGDTGDLIRVRVIAFDGTWFSDPFTSPPVTVG